MPMGSNCEVCNAAPLIIQAGEFAGQRDIFSYCEFCSKDLCSNCMVNGRCSEAADHKHRDALAEEIA